MGGLQRVSPKLLGMLNAQQQQSRRALPILSRRALDCCLLPSVRYGGILCCLLGQIPFMSSDSHRSKSELMEYTVLLYCLQSAFSSSACNVILRCLSCRRFFFQCRAHRTESALC